MLGLFAQRAAALKRFSFFKRMSVSPGRGILVALGLIVSLIASGSTALALPVPQTTLNVPSSALLGETFTFEVKFKNASTAGDFGFGPFIDVAVDFGGIDDNTGSPSGLCDGLSIDISSPPKMVGVNGAPASLPTQVYGNTNTANCTTNATATSDSHPYPGVGTITYPQGWQVATIELPFGSFDQSQPEIIVEVTATIHNHADLYQPLQICTRGGFQFGNSATGSTPILENPTTAGNANDVATWKCKTVTPKLIIVKKKYVGPEDETATGPNFVHQYEITVDIAAGQTVGDFSNPLKITDCMADGVIYRGNVTFVPPPFPPDGWPQSVWGSYSLSEPPVWTNDGCLTVSWPTSSTNSVVGQPGTDARFQFDFHVNDKYTNGAEILGPDCSLKKLTNELSAVGYWVPLDVRDQPSPGQGIPVNEADNNAHELSAKCLAIQKAVSLMVGNTPVPIPPAGPRPGDTLQYTLNFQISDYKTIGKISIEDWLSNGHVLVGPAPTLTVGDQFGSYTINLTNLFTVTQNAPFSTLGCPVNNATKLRFLVSTALASAAGHPRHAAGILSGGLAVGSSLQAPATGQIVFNVRIADTYDNMQPRRRFIDKHDPLCNAVRINGTNFRNISTPRPVPTVELPPLVRDSSGSAFAIVDGLLSKSVYAVKRGTSFICGPAVTLAPRLCNPGEEVFPGDDVTFQLNYVVPSGDAENLRITDWLPLPIFNVTTINLTCPGSAIPPPPNSASCSQNHSGAPLPVPPVSADSTTNSISFDYGTFNNPANTPLTIDLLFTFTVTNAPFADGLYLTNEAQQCEDNSFSSGRPFCDVAIAQVKVREPNLKVRKGAIWTNNPNGSFDPPASSGQTAAHPSGYSFDPTGVTGTVTSDDPGSLLGDSDDPGSLLGDSDTTNNIGNYFDSDLFYVDANDLVTFAIVIENTGGYDAFDVHLEDYIPWDRLAGRATCFEFVPDTLMIRDGAGNVLSPVVGLASNNFNVTFTSASIPALDSTTINTGENIVIITFQVRMLAPAELKAGCCENTARLTHYASIAGWPNFVDAGFGGPFEDKSRVCVGPRAVSKCIQTTSEAHTSPQSAAMNGQVDAAIGEIVRFRLITTIPEGTTQGFRIQDALPIGLTYLQGTAEVIAVADSGFNTNPLTPLVAHPIASLANCPGDPSDSLLLWIPISEAPNAFPVGQGTDPAFPAASISVTNNDNDSNLEYLVIEFNAQLDNIAANQDGTVLSNTFGVVYTGQPAPSTAGPVNVSIVEPKLEIEKEADPTTVPSLGSHLVTFTVTIRNTGTATAFDIAFQDTLPSGWSTIPNSISSPQICTQSVNGQILSVDCTGMGLAVGEELVIEYEVDVSCGKANLAEVIWTSLPGSNGTVSNPTGSSTTGNPGDDDGERNGSTAPLTPNDYKASDSVTVECSPVGVLKVCKVAGKGVAVGTLFTFHATPAPQGAGTVQVPAGPPPGGYCQAMGYYAVGTQVVLNEDIPAGTSVANISVAPPNQLIGSPDYSNGTVQIQMGTGVTEVTYTNKGATGWFEVCKGGPVKGEFSFSVPGYPAPIPVLASTCSPALEGPVGDLVITELPGPNGTLSDCHAYPSDRLVACDPSAGTATVTIVGGDVSTQTIVFFSNHPPGELGPQAPDKEKALPGLPKAFSSPTLQQQSMELRESGRIKDMAGIARATTLKCTPSLALPGAMLTCTANVNAPRGTDVGGLVSFVEGGRILARVPVNRDGTARFVTPWLDAGSHTITATHHGDEAYEARPSRPFKLKVAPKQRWNH